MKTHDKRKIKFHIFQAMYVHRDAILFVATFDEESSSDDLLSDILHISKNNRPETDHIIQIDRK